MGSSLSSVSFVAVLVVMMMIMMVLSSVDYTVGAFVVVSRGTAHARQTHHRLLLSNNEIDTCDNTENASAGLSRRSAWMAAAKSASAALVALSIDPLPSSAADLVVTKYPISATWKAVDGLNTMEEDKKNFVGFDAASYQAMISDQSRTPLFYKVMADRIQKGTAKTVLDLGTGPFAIFAIKAAELGAEKVYAIEASPAAAQLARETIQKKGFADVITVLEGFSTDLELPNNDKVDLVIAEIIGSVASEEGVVATIVDAHKRFAKNPALDESWIPSRVQTYAAPASYTLHNLFGPPGFDWNKLEGEPVRFNCRDMGLQLFADPQIVEDIRFADILKYPASNQKTLVYTANEDRIKANQDMLVTELQANKLGKAQAIRAAEATAASFTGMAFWPRLILENNDDVNANAAIINSRKFPKGGHQKSHWQTVVPIMNDRPVPLRSGDSISVNINFSVGDLQTPASYKVDGTVASTAEARPDGDLMKRPQSYNTTII